MWLTSYLYTNGSVLIKRKRDKKLRFFLIESRILSKQNYSGIVLSHYNALVIFWKGCETQLPVLRRSLYIIITLQHRQDLFLTPITGFLSMIKEFCLFTCSCVACCNTIISQKFNVLLAKCAIADVSYHFIRLVFQGKGKHCNKITFNFCCYPVWGTYQGP